MTKFKQAVVAGGIILIWGAGIVVAWKAGEFAGKGVAKVCTVATEKLLAL